MEIVGRKKAIRLKCLDCCCGNSAEVRRCHITECPLWNYRMGSLKRSIGEESEETEEEDGD